jgi:hypothetical protein
MKELRCLIAKVEVARAVDGQAPTLSVRQNGLRSAGSDFHQTTLPVDAGRVAEAKTLPAASTASDGREDVGSHQRGLPAEAEIRHLRSGAGAVDGHGGEHVAGAVGDDHRSPAQAWRERGEVDVDDAVGGVGE